MLSCSCEIRNRQPDVVNILCSLCYTTIEKILRRFMYCVWHWNNNIEAKNSLNYYTAMEVLLVLRLTVVMWLLMRLAYYTVSCILQSKLIYLLLLQDTEDSTDDDFEREIQQAIAASKMSTVGEPSHTR